MNTPLKKYYLLIPVLYLSLAGFLMYTGMNIKSESFVIKDGPVTISGSGQPGLDENLITDLAVDIPGLRMNFFNNPVYLVDGEGNRINIKVTGYTREDGILTVSFSNSARFVITYDPDNAEKGAVHAVFSVSGDEKKYSQVFLPAEAVFTFKQVSFLPAYSFNDRGSGKLLTFPADSFFDDTAGILAISLTDNNASFSLDDTGSIDPVSFYFFGSKGPAGKDTFEKEKEKYIENSYSAWRTGRFDAGRGEWKDPFGEYTFDSRIMASLSAESLKRGRFSDFSKFVSAVEANKDKFSFLSAPFTGGIVVTDEQRRKEDDLLKKRISTAAAKNDYSVFLTDDLVERLNWISSSALYRTFNALAASADLDGRLSPEILTGMVSVYRDVIKGNTDQFHDVLRFYSVIESGLYPHMVRTEGGLFLKNSKGDIDLLLSLKAGLALYEIGQIDEDPMMASIGRTMTADTLGKAGADGLIPRFLDSGGMKKKGGESFYGADMFYPLMADNEYYPHIVSYGEGTSSEIRIWTAAKDFSFSKKGSTLSFEVSFPRGISHHLVMKGIPPFKTLKMHGIPWNSDRRFQYYTSGWVYNEKTRTLYMKLSQRKNRERIDIIINE